MSLFCLAVSAQNNPNRLLVHEKSGNIKGFLVERVDSLSFAKVEGRVAADVTFNKYENSSTGDKIWVTVKRTENCQAFRIACLSSMTASMLTTDASAISYIESYGTSLLWEDFDNGELSGFDTPFQPGVGYTILTAGYDRYGVACEVSKAEFTTPTAPLVGNPTVDYSFSNVTTNSFDMTVTPNADTKWFAAVAFEEGTAEESFNMGAMFGYTSRGDVIKGWGPVPEGQYTISWTSMKPGTNYEVYIQPWDVNDNYADMVIAKVRTKDIGGTGVAEMTITLGEFGGSASTGYYQTVIYTPNDQVALHRDMAIEKEAYETSWGDEGVLEYLKTDDPFSATWDQFGVDVAQWNADLGKAYIAFSIGRNANGEWGPLARLDYTAPSTFGAGAPARKAPVVPYRITEPLVKTGPTVIQAPALTVKAAKAKLTLTK